MNVFIFILNAHKINYKAAFIHRTSSGRKCETKRTEPFSLSLSLSGICRIDKHELMDWMEHRCSSSPSGNERKKNTKNARSTQRWWWPTQNVEYCPRQHTNSTKTNSAPMHFKWPLGRAYGRMMLVGWLAAVENRSGENDYYYCCTLAIAIDNCETEMFFCVCLRVVRVVCSATAHCVMCWIKQQPHARTHEPKKRRCTILINYTTDSNELSPPNVNIYLFYMIRARCVCECFAVADVWFWCRGRCFLFFGHFLCDVVHNGKHTKLNCMKLINNW